MTVLVRDPDCPDCCIVSQPVAKKTGLGFAIEVTEGRNLIRSRVGYFNTVYPADSMTEASLTLGLTDTYEATAVKCLMVNTDTPVSVTVGSAGVYMTLVVQSMLFLDSAYDQITISSPVLGDKTSAKVFVAYTQ